MLHNSFLFRMAGITLFVGAAMAMSQTTQYHFETIDIKQPGASAITALGINAEGHIVSRYTIGKAIHGYLLSDACGRSRQSERTADRPVTYANGVNPEGDVAGYYLDSPPLTDFCTMVQGQMGMDFDMSDDPPPSTRLRGFLRSHYGGFTPIVFPHHKWAHQLWVASN